MRPPSLRPLILPTVFTLIVGAVLIGLGLWQLHRLAWKDAIIARIEARAKAPATALPPPSQWSALRPDDYEYRRVTVTGTFDNAKETPVFRAEEAGPGYLIMTPLALAGGGTVLVNRGYVPEKLKDPSTRPAGEPSGTVTVTGLMRQPEPRNAFTPADELEKNLFFTRDPVLLAKRDGLADAAPFTIDADATPNPGGWPRGGMTELAIPNNHFSYAITWFGLAIGLLCVYAGMVWKHVRPATVSDEHAGTTSLVTR